MEEDDTQMAIRLTSFLEQQEQLRCDKRRWMLGKWPEHDQLESKCKRRRSNYSTQKCIEESFVREWQAVSEIREAVEKAATASEQKVENTLQLRFNNIQNLSDADLMKETPTLLGFLRLGGLKALLSTLSSEDLGKADRAWFEKCIAEKLENTPMSTPEVFRHAIAVLRDVNSWMLNPQRTSFSIPFPEMPPRRLAAANAAFSALVKLPSRNIEAIGKLLRGGVLDAQVKIPYTRFNTRVTRTALSVQNKAKKLLSSVKEGEPLPARVQNALHAISLCARDVYGTDGGLNEILDPLPTEVKAMENRFFVALSNLEKMRPQDLQKVCCEILGMPRKQHPIMFRKTLKMVLLDSLPGLYNGSVPECIARTISAMNEAGKRETNAKPLKKISSKGKIMKEQRIHSEVEVVLGLSSRLQGIVRDFVEFQSKQGVCHTDEATDKPPEVDTSFGKVDAEVCVMQIDLQEDSGIGVGHFPEGNEASEILFNGNDITEKVEKVGDEMAITAYSLICFMIEEGTINASRWTEDSKKEEYSNIGMEDLNMSEKSAGINQSSSDGHADIAELVLARSEKLLPSWAVSPLSVTYSFSFLMHRPYCLSHSQAVSFMGGTPFLSQVILPLSCMGGIAFIIHKWSHSRVVSPFSFIVVENARRCLGSHR